MKDKDINTSNNLAWDTSGSHGNNNWRRPSTLNTYLNSTYYNNLNATAKTQIVSKEFSVGNIKYSESDMPTQIEKENSIKWEGMIALPTVSEYIRSNSNKNSCGTFKKIMIIIVIAKRQLGCLTVKLGGP